MQTTAAAVTMVRDDAFFLERWVSYYGGLFGRENCYVVSHGGGEIVARVAQGCNVMAIPGKTEKFDMLRWRLLNNLVGGLRQYFKYVVVGDVDEYVVIDPEAGMDLLGFLERAPGRKVLTPLGLEVMHRVNEEVEPITGPILGPRRFARVTYHYSKPCVIGAPAKISRGGHFSSFGELFTPDAMYLFHMKYCDLGQYGGVMDRRNEAVAVSGAKKGETGIGGHWFPEERGDDEALFRGIVSKPVVRGFEMSQYRKKMHDGWSRRGEELWQFPRGEFEHLHEVPERFFGVV